MLSMTVDEAGPTLTTLIVIGALVVARSLFKK